MCIRDRHYSKPLADFAGVAQENAPGKVMEWQSRPGYMPFITAGQKPVFLDAPASLSALTNATWNPRETVFLPLAAESQLHVKNRAEARIVSSTYTIHRQQCQVEAREPALVVFAQAYYSPWKAYVNGKPARIWQANHAFQALEVPAGISDVKMIYEDHLFQLGAIISLLTAFLCGAYAFRGAAPQRMVIPWN